MLWFYVIFEKKTCGSLFNLDTIILHIEYEFIKAIVNITIVLSQHFGSFMAWNRWLSIHVFSIWLQHTSMSIPTKWTIAAISYKALPTTPAFSSTPVTLSFLLVAFMFTKPTFFTRMSQFWLQHTSMSTFTTKRTIATISDRALTTTPAFISTPVTLSFLFFACTPAVFTRMSQFD